jgi:ParB-like chromosome segregation protein Spo0J
MSWRDVLQVHPAAELFPVMSESELKELADDIAANGLQQKIKLLVHKGRKSLVVDGRNRLSALELAGKAPTTIDGAWKTKYFDEIKLADEDVAAYVIGANIHRRQRVEQAGDVSTAGHVVDTKGRRQPAHKTPRKPERTKEAVAQLGAAQIKAIIEGENPPSLKRAARARAKQIMSEAGVEGGVPEFLRRVKLPAAEFEHPVESPDPPTVTAPAERGTKAAPKPSELPSADSARVAFAD